jgi:hypothetical protein
VEAVSPRNVGPSVRFLAYLSALFAKYYWFLRIPVTNSSGPRSNAVAVTIMTGFVRKKALGRDKMDWKLRYLVLTGNLLKYYESFVDLDSTKAPKGTLKLRKESTVKAPAYFHPHEVEVTVKPGKVLYFYTEDKVEQEQWLTAIGAAIHALQPQPEKGWCC